MSIVATTRLFGALAERGAGIFIVAFATVLLAGCGPGSTPPPPPLTAELIGARFGFGTVRSFDVSAYGDLIAAGSDVGRLYLWDVSTNAFRAAVERHSPVTAVRFAGQTVFAGARDGDIVRYDTAGNILSALGRKGSAVLALAVSNKATVAVAGCEDGHLILWAPPRGTPLEVAAHIGPVRGVAISPDGKTVYTAGDDGVIKSWGFPALTPVHASTSQKSRILSLVISSDESADGGRLFAGCEDGGIRVMDPRTLSVISRYNDLGTPVFALATYGPLLAGGGNQKLAVWNTAKDAGGVKMLTAQQGGVYACAFGPDGKTLAAGGDAKVIAIHNLADAGHEEPREIGHPSTVTSVAFSSDDRWIASGGNGSNIPIWEAANGALARLFTPSPGSGAHGDVESVAWSGTMMAAGYENGAILVFDGQGRVIGSARHTEQVNDVAFAPDGSLLASAGWDNEIRLWKISTGTSQNCLQAAGELRGHTNGVSAISLTPDGKSIGSSSWDQTARFWDVQTQHEKMRFGGLSGPVFAIACGRLRPVLVAGGWRGQTWGWDTNDATILYRKEPQTDVVFRVSFSPDGKRLASGSADRTVQIFDTEANMSPVNKFVGFRGSIRGLSWTRNGERLAIGSFDGNVFVLPVQGAAFPSSRGAPVTPGKGASAAPAPAASSPPAASPP